MVNHSLSQWKKYLDTKNGFVKLCILFFKDRVGVEMFWDRQLGMLPHGNKYKVDSVIV